MILPIIMAVGPTEEARTRHLFHWLSRLGRQPAMLVLMLAKEVSDLSDLVRPLFDGVTVERFEAFDQCVGGGAASDFSMKMGRQLFQDSHYLHTEPDAIPICRDWVEKIMRYHGPDVITTMSGAWTDSTEWTGQFLNAIAVYPARYRHLPIPAGANGSDRTNCAKYQTGLKVQENRAFTHIYGYELWNPLPVIEHIPTFPTQKEVEILLEHFPETVLFHRCQDGTLIDRLQERSLV